MEFNVSMADVEKVSSGGSAPDGSGAFRNVYFLNDDIVIKIGDSYSNQCEIGHYEEFRYMEGAYTTKDGATYNVRFPYMEMLTETVIVAERVRHSRIPYYSTGVCCLGEAAGFGTQRYHTDDCAYEKVGHDVREIMARFFSLFDMHNDNWFYDWRTNTIWPIDIAG